MQQTQTLPRHPDGTINTSAEYGPGPLLVEITYNTDPQGNWTDDNTNRTLHGPFTTHEEATTWINNCRPDDTDIQDMLILHTNNIRPT